MVPIAFARSDSFAMTVAVPLLLSMDREDAALVFEDADERVSLKRRTKSCGSAIAGSQNF